MCEWYSCAVVIDPKLNVGSILLVVGYFHLKLLFAVWEWGGGSWVLDHNQ
jgi:hypothetical protein